MKVKNFLLPTKFLKVFPKLFILILLLISFNNLKAQTDEQIINDIFDDLFDPCQERLLNMDTIYIAETKGKTFFIHDSYKNIGGFDIPANIISEWRENIANQIIQSKWNEKRLNKIDTTFVGKDTFIRKNSFFLKCLSESEIKKIVDNQKLHYFTNEEPLYSIGNIIFDKSKENAIFRVDVSSSPGSSLGYTVFIKKVFGRWVIITSFDYLI